MTASTQTETQERIERIRIAIVLACVVLILVGLATAISSIALGEFIIGMGTGIIIGSFGMNCAIRYCGK